MTIINLKNAVSQGEQIKALLQAVFNLTEKASKIQGTLTKPAPDPTNAGVVSRKKVVKISETTEGGVTTRTVVKKVRTQIDEGAREKQLREASRSRLPALANELMQTGKINVQGVEITLEELKGIQEQLKELGFGDLLKKLLPRGGSQMIDMDSLMRALEQKEGESQKSSIEPHDETQNESKQTHEDHQPSEQLDNPTEPAKSETGNRGGILSFLMSPFSALKRRRGRTIVNQGTEAVKEHLAGLSDADLGKAIREMLGLGQEK